MSVSQKSIFKKIIINKYQELPDLIKLLHQNANETIEGKCIVKRGKSAIANYLADFFGFPPEASNATISISIKREENIEIWKYKFGNHILIAELSCQNNKLKIKINSVEYIYNLIAHSDSLEYKLQDLKVFGFSISYFAYPEVEYSEYEENGTLHFAFSLSIPYIGTIIEYRTLN